MTTAKMIDADTLDTLKNLLLPEGGNGISETTRKLAMQVVEKIERSPSPLITEPISPDLLNPYQIEDQGEIKAVCGPTLHTLVMRDMVSAGALRDALNHAFVKGREIQQIYLTHLRVSHAALRDALQGLLRNPSSIDTQAAASVALVNSARV